MAEFYPEIRLVHIAAAIAAGSLFLLRAAAVLAGAAWPHAGALQILGYAIDTVLLTAALMLMTIIGQYPFADAWLTVKVLLVALYVALAALALRRRVGRAQRLAWFGAAIAAFAFVVTIARARDPLGIFA
jgi:uncharacterized membrane protein SirB2